MKDNSKAIPDYYLFYEQNDKNGLRYDIAIDNAIITQLSHKETFTSGKLKQAVEESINRKLSPDTFYGHRNVLVDCKILNKEDNGRGKEVFYSLSENAENLLKLNLLGGDWERIKLFTRIYEKFFLYEVLHDPLLIVRTEEELDSLISDLGVRREGLEWGITMDATNEDSVKLIYGDNIDFPVKNIPKKALSKYWHERKGQFEVSEKIEFICFPKKPYNLDVVFYRKEYWKINKYLPSGIERIEYTITIPGVSVQELVGGDSSFQSQKFNYDDVEKAIELLKHTDLIEPAIKFQGHIRYKIKDADEHLLTGLNLRYLMSVLKVLYDQELLVLSGKWKLFEEPTNEEKKRWTWLMGEKESKKFFDKLGIERYENRKEMRQSGDVFDYHIRLNNICEREFSSPVHGPWPYLTLYDDFKEKRREEKKEQEKREQERRKKRGKRWSRTKKIGGTKKELKNDILKYEQYLLKKLESQLERLPINLENEGIKDLRIMFSNTIQKYPFMRGILKYISPRFFEHELTKEEIELGKNYNEIEREKADTLYGVYNPVTKKRERSVVEEIPDITKYLRRLRSSHKTNKKRNKERNSR